MKTTQTRQLAIAGGACGIAGTLCYIIVITVSMSSAATFFVAMLWPILSIVFAFALYKVVASEADGAFNQLAFIMACIAFALVAAMLSIQLAVGIGVDEYARTPSATDEMLKLIRHSVRMVDMGLDVAWDMFIGTSLILLSIAMKKHSGFGLAWSIPSGLLGLLLIGLNTATFPWPPNTQGLFDIGPFIGVYILALSIRLIIIGNKLKKANP